MTDVIKWQLYANKDRTTSIDNIKNIIEGKNGYIIDSHIYSDLEISLILLIDGTRLFELYRELSKTFLIEEEWDESELIFNYEQKVLINVSFSKGKGSLRNVIPDVPG